MPSDANKQLHAKEVKIERNYPKDLQTHFVMNIIVQHQPDFFTLSFFEVFPPAILGATPEEKKAEFDAISRVEAKCVARLIVPPEKMHEFAKAINQNLAEYEMMIKLQSKQN
jgi:hypothetical protein